MLPTCWDKKQLETEWITPQKKKQQWAHYADLEMLQISTKADILEEFKNTPEYLAA